MVRNFVWLQRLKFSCQVALHLEQSTGRKILWGLLQIECQYHPVFIQLQHTVLVFPFCLALSISFHIFALFLFVALLLSHFFFFYIYVLLLFKTHSSLFSMMHALQNYMKAYFMP